MSTIASPRVSPRPSISLSSRRGSASTDNTITSASSKPDRGTLRRNRVALRDYYNLQTTAPADGRITSEPPTPTLDAEQESTLDKAGFEPASYVTNLLATEGLEGVLKVEAGLVSDIRSLDGEKKALVYDNYSKLITATETIRSMREKMDPMMPGTSTLSPAIGHIAEMAGNLQRELRVHARNGGGVDKRQQQREVVRWVVQAPGRIEGLVVDGEEEKAREEWRRVEEVLGKWEGVEGVGDVRRRCEEVLGRG